MTRLGLRLCTIAFCLLTIVTWSFGQEEPKTETAPPAAQPTPAAGATHKVKQEPFKIEVEISGTFEAEETLARVARSQDLVQLHGRQGGPAWKTCAERRDARLARLEGD